MAQNYHHHNFVKSMWEEIVNFVNNIVLGAIALVRGWINSPTQTSSPPTPLATPSATVEVLSGGISGAVPTTDQATLPAAPNPTNNHNGNMREWPLLVIGVCFAAAALGLQAIQTFETLRLSFHYFCLALQFSVSALIVSIYIRTRYPLASLVMEHVSIFFAGTALTVVMAMKLLTSFMLILVAVYLISILVILFVNLFGHAT